MGRPLKLLCSLALVVVAGCPPAKPPPPPPGPGPTPSDSATQPPPPHPQPTEAAFKRFLPERAKALRDAEASRRNLIASFGFSEDATMCVPPPPLAAPIDVDKSLFVHDVATLGGPTGPFELRKTLQKLADQAVAGGAPVATTTPETLFASFWQTEAAPACSGGINGYPIQCPRNESTQASAAAVQLALYQPIALVNRLDLADEGWRSCGEHRIIYGRSDSSTFHRNFIIFEAVLPNPKPGCRSACRPVMEKWAELSSLTPAAAQPKLKEFYFDGIPGFRPVVHVDHYSAFGVRSGYGSSRGGQIRSNQFLNDAPWLLREFNLLLDCGGSPCNLSAVPTMVKVNPFGDLWSQNLAANAADPMHDLAAQFQADLLAVSGGGTTPDAVASLAQTEFEKFGYAVDPKFDGGDSDAQNALPTNGHDDYLAEFNLAATSGGFHDQLSNFAGPAGVTPDQLVHRALAQSCAGCHQPGLFGLTGLNAIGNAHRFDGTPISVWPASLGFVHVGEVAAGGSFPISPALQTAFLPFRKHNLETELAKDVCLCRRDLPTFPGRQKVLDRQKLIFEKLKPKLDALRKRVPPPPVPGQPLAIKPTDAARLKKDIVAVGEDFERQLAEGLKADGVKLEPLALDLKPQLQRVALPAAAATDEQKAAARRGAVLEQLKSEPPRRTVTGHFRVH